MVVVLEFAHCVNVFLHVFVLHWFLQVCVCVSAVCVSHSALTSSKTADWIRLVQH